MSALIHSVSPKTHHFFLWKMFKDTKKRKKKKTPLLFNTFEANTCGCILLKLFRRFPDAREITWTHSSSSTLLCGISEAAGCVSVMISCPVLKNEHPLHFCRRTEWWKWNITSSIESRLLSLRMCVTAWCARGLYCMYICAFIHVGVCVCIYVCVIYAHVTYTLWYIHTPMWTQQILYCFGTKYTTILRVCL